MKYFLLLFFVLCSFIQKAAAQSGNDSVVSQAPPAQVQTVDTAKPVVKKVPKPTVKKTVIDSMKSAQALVKKDSTLPIRDSIQPVKDSVAPATKAATPEDTTTVYFNYGRALMQNGYYNFTGNPVLPRIQIKNHDHKEDEFYLLVMIILFFAMIRVVFAKYMQNLFTVMFRASLKQKQIREQLSQTPLPSLLLNIFFVLVAATFATFLLRYYNQFKEVNFWLVVLYSSVIISLIYFIKFLVLKFTGWVFNLKAAANTYIFIVFLTNKMLALFLLPLVILIAFQSAQADIWVTISFILVIIALVYRYLASFGPIRSEIKVKQIHFFLYLCAFEIAPLLLIYKVLLNFFEKTV
ncbi:DUF4271 domain-containing protein [Pinibacter soli]|uniref:DUF4271 domain-containing protein n=1 Tax=Pinibacter soli TaxID=3044211 RepID=A0ABT6R7L0_9BACT|nr:DUF4271 domain-containing protein [Pinibacter soli]MDI3318543.1 DUF4271 domain-containing protein [Pinibacter soli]